MKPTVLSYKKLDEQFVKDELAQLNHVIDQDNESRAMVGKPALPHEIRFKSTIDWWSGCSSWKEDIKAELAAEGKPENLGIKTIPGKWILLGQQRLTKPTLFLHKSPSWMTARRWKLTLNQQMLQLSNSFVWSWWRYWKSFKWLWSEVAATMAAALNN